MSAEDDYLAAEVAQKLLGVPVPEVPFLLSPNYCRDGYVSTFMLREKYHVPVEFSVQLTVLNIILRPAFSLTQDGYIILPPQEDESMYDEIYRTQIAPLLPYLWHRRLHGVQQWPQT